MIKLPNELETKCYLYGHHMADHYARGGSPNSRAVSSHGMEANSEGLGDGKRAECIFALEMGLDPMIAVQWITRVDGGADVIVGGARVDVKGTALDRRLLIYPYRKWAAGVFNNARCDYFVLVKIRRFDQDRQCEGASVGWCTKDYFQRKHHMADGSTPKGITAGTPYLDQDELEGMATFPKRPPWSQSVKQAAQAIRAGKQFDFISGRWP